ncbi:MAG: DUF1015 domain-containing protein [Thermodesulfobacteriota bacterium]|nr:DUF1015 domain-containing protein [Thermodesulfobacteriota bacterium]
MAEIAPFRGLRYNPLRVADLNQVVIPPYDVISPEEQDFFHALSPYNMIHLELGKASQEDTERENPHTRAGCFLDAWRSEGVLIRDEVPSLYHYELDYTLGSRRLTRKGFVGLLRLEDFSTGRVRPHEKTFSKVKSERLGLMLSCHANLSPVFALYSDPEGRVEALFQDREVSPCASFRDRNGLDHRLRRVTSPNVFRELRRLMQDRMIFIADGHHRYETALKFRDILRERHPGAGPRAPFEFVMVYLSPMEGEGLSILPTHRLLKHVGRDAFERALPAAEAFFQVTPFDATEERDRRRWMARLSEAAEARRTAVGVAVHGGSKLFLLTARDDRMRRFLDDQGVPGVLQSLDVVILDRVVLRRILGLSESFLSDPRNIQFSHDLDEGLTRVLSGVNDLGFFVNPTRVDQVRDVASAGLIMPHKATYFYPKVSSGLVLHPIDVNEEVALF